MRGLFLQTRGWGKVRRKVRFYETEAGAEFVLCSLWAHSRSKCAALWKFLSAFLVSRDDLRLKSRYLKKGGKETLNTNSVLLIYYYLQVFLLVYKEITLSTTLYESVELSVISGMKLISWSRHGGGQALAHGRRKDTIKTMRETERGNDRRRIRGREKDDGHRDVSLEPRVASSGLFCFSTFGLQMISGLTCDMLSWKADAGENWDRPQFLCLYFIFRP